MGIADLLRAKQHWEVNLYMTPWSMDRPIKDLRRYQGPNHALLGSVCPKVVWALQSCAISLWPSFIMIPLVLGTQQQSIPRDGSECGPGLK